MGWQPGPDSPKTAETTDYRAPSSPTPHSSDTGDTGSSLGTHQQQASRGGSSLSAHQLPPSSSRPSSSASCGAGRVRTEQSVVVEVDSRGDSSQGSNSGRATPTSDAGASSVQDAPSRGSSAHTSTREPELSCNNSSASLPEPAACATPTLAAPGLPRLDLTASSGAWGLDAVSGTHLPIPTSSAAAAAAALPTTPRKMLSIMAKLQGGSMWAKPSVMAAAATSGSAAPPAPPPPTPYIAALFLPPSTAPPRPAPPAPPITVHTWAGAVAGQGAPAGGATPHPTYSAPSYSHRPLPPCLAVGDAASPFRAAHKGRGDTTSSHAPHPHNPHPTSEPSRHFPTDHHQHLHNPHLGGGIRAPPPSPLMFELARTSASFSGATPQLPTLITQLLHLQSLARPGTVPVPAYVLTQPAPQLPAVPAGRGGGGQQYTSVGGGVGTSSQPQAHPHDRLQPGAHAHHHPHTPCPTPTPPHGGTHAPPTGSHQHPYMSPNRDGTPAMPTDPASLAPPQLHCRRKPLLVALPLLQPPAGIAVSLPRVSTTPNRWRTGAQSLSDAVAAAVLPGGGAAPPPMREASPPPYRSLSSPLPAQQRERCVALCAELQRSSAAWGGTKPPGGIAAPGPTSPPPHGPRAVLGLGGTGAPIVDPLFLMSLLAHSGGNNNGGASSMRSRPPFAVFSPRNPIPSKGAPVSPSASSASLSGLVPALRPCGAAPTQQWESGTTLPLSQRGGATGGGATAYSGAQAVRAALSAGQPATPAAAALHHPHSPLPLVPVARQVESRGRGL